MGPPKHTLYWIYAGLILLLIPAIIALADRYEKSLSPQSPLPSMPPEEVVLRGLAAFDSTASALHLKEVYQAVPASRSGVLSAYRVVTDDEALAYRLVVVRHDIACPTCRDLLVGILLAPEADRVVGVWPLASWELADGPFDPTAFFAQLSGRALAEPLVVGQNMDGITGATLSVNALVTQWSQAGSWLSGSRGVFDAELR